MAEFDGVRYDLITVWNFDCRDNAIEMEELGVMKAKQEYIDLHTEVENNESAAKVQTLPNIPLTSEATVDAIENELPVDGNTYSSIQIERSHTMKTEPITPHQVVRNTPLSTASAMNVISPHYCRIDTTGDNNTEVQVVMEKSVEDINFQLPQSVSTTDMATTGSDLASDTKHCLMESLQDRTYPCTLKLEENYIFPAVDVMQINSDWLDDTIDEIIASENVCIGTKPVNINEMSKNIITCDIFPGPAESYSLTDIEIRSNSEEHHFLGNQSETTQESPLPCSPQYNCSHDFNDIEHKIIDPHYDVINNTHKENSVCYDSGSNMHISMTDEYSENIQPEIYTEENIADVDLSLSCRKTQDINEAKHQYFPIQYGHSDNSPSTEQTKSLTQILAHHIPRPNITIFTQQPQIEDSEDMSPRTIQGVKILTNNAISNENIIERGTVPIIDPNTCVASPEQNLEVYLINNGDSISHSGKDIDNTYRNEVKVSSLREDKMPETDTVISSTATISYTLPYIPITSDIASYEIPLHSSKNIEYLGIVDENIDDILPLTYDNDIIINKRRMPFGTCADCISNPLEICITCNLMSSTTAVLHKNNGSHADASQSKKDSILLKETSENIRSLHIVETNTIFCPSSTVVSIMSGSNIDQTENISGMVECKQGLDGTLEEEMQAENENHIGHDKSSDMSDSILQESESLLSNQYSLVCAQKNGSEEDTNSIENESSACKGGELLSTIVNPNYCLSTCPMQDVENGTHFAQSNTNNIQHSTTGDEISHLSYGMLSVDYNFAITDKGSRETLSTFLGNDCDLTLNVSSRLSKDQSIPSEIPQMTIDANRIIFEESFKADLPHEKEHNHSIDVVQNKLNIGKIGDFEHNSGNSRSEDINDFLTECDDMVYPSVNTYTTSGFDRCESNSKLGIAIERLSLSINERYLHDENDATTMGFNDNSVIIPDISPNGFTHMDGFTSPFVDPNSSPSKLFDDIILDFESITLPTKQIEPVSVTTQQTASIVTSPQQVDEGIVMHDNDECHKCTIQSFQISFENESLPCLTNSDEINVLTKQLFTEDVGPLIPVDSTSHKLSELDITKLKMVKPSENMSLNNNQTIIYDLSSARTPQNIDLVTNIPFKNSATPNLCPNSTAEISPCTSILDESPGRSKKKQKKKKGKANVNKNMEDKSSVMQVSSSADLSASSVDLSASSSYLPASSVDLSVSSADLSTSSVDLSRVEGIAELKSLGPDVLKTELQARGLKCGGALWERAERLWQVRELSPADYPAKLKPKKNK